MEYISGSSERDLICMMAASIYARGQASMQQAAQAAIKICKFVDEELERLEKEKV